MGFDMLSADGADAERWKDILEALPGHRRDIHFTPEYGNIYRDSYGFEPCLAVYRDNGGFILQPFVQRSLKGLPFLEDADDAGRFSDIANPYGFGGPLSNCDGAEGAGLYRRFSQHLAEWCDANNVASEFGSLHPLFEREQRMLIADVLSPSYVKDVVTMDVGGGAKRILERINRGNRSSIAKAKRAGVRIERVTPTREHLRTFEETYRATMVRRAAAERWFVPDGFFPAIFQRLGDRHSSLFFAWAGEEIETVYLLIHGFNTAYYFFAGTRAVYPERRTNNLMMFETAVWAGAAGYGCYFLGGGVTVSPDDSLLRFKAGFSAQRAPLYTYFTVRNRAVYDELCTRKRAFERKTAGAESDSQFLPLYRR